MYKSAHTPTHTPTLSPTLSPTLPPRQTTWHPPMHPLRVNLGHATALAALHTLGTRAVPHTEWRMPSGHPQFDPPGLASRLIGRMRRLRSRWRRMAAARGVQRLHA